MADDKSDVLDTEQQPTPGQLGIQKIYVKDLSFEAPNTPTVFTEKLNPTVDIHFSNETKDLGDAQHEVVLSVTVTVKQDDRSVYLVEVQQAGIFTISGFPVEHLPAILATACPNILFPYAREVVSDIATKGGFPQILLAPVNFEMLYAQELRRRQQDDAKAPTH
ncbi:MAG: protein-export chaperone SecB [Gammaproteobacteria bacterium]|jgi:preprotein translocase subunit SecB|nr:protein-export chaperone SecB [Gammaproteobacteria bacterium]